MPGRHVQTSVGPGGGDPARRVHARPGEGPNGVLERLRACPDLALVLGGRMLRPAELPAGSCTVDDEAVLLDRAAAGSPSLAAMAVREALEVATDRAAGSSGPDGGPGPPGHARVRELARRIVAHLTAVAYADLVRGLGDQPSSLSRAEARREVRGLAELGSAASPAQRRRVVAAVTAALLDRDGSADERDGSADDPVVLDAAASRAATAAVLALPTAVLLTAGGDDRLVVDWGAGENRYGISPLPRPEVRSYSSCTASSPSPIGYAAADRVRRRLLRLVLDHPLDTAGAHPLDTALEREWDELRRRLVATMLGAGPGTGVAAIPTPSGTDAESLALTVSAGAGRPVTAVLVAPLELGSGTALAVVGRAFSPRSPDGRELAPGALLPELPPDTRCCGVEVRDRDGRPRDPEAVEAEIAGHLARIVSADRQAVLHVVEGSKTGVRLPRAEAVALWTERYGDRLDVVVDAAQLRVEASTVASHVAAGRMTIVTGSKFLAGPPFSGALFVPAALVPRLRDRPCPDGLGAYLDRAATPPALRTLRRVAPPHPNLGLLLRWAAAGAEHEAFLRIPVHDRDRVLRHLAAVTREQIVATPGLELVAVAGDAATGSQDLPPSEGNLASASTPRLEDVPSIFTFRVLQDGRALDVEELRSLQRLLRTDLAAAVPADVDAEARRLLARRFAFGQPVPLGPDGVGGAALRLAFGAPTLTRVVHDEDRGPDLRARLDREAMDVRTALAKLRTVLDHRLVG
jgi:hypothetical protein